MCLDDVGGSQTPLHIAAWQRLLSTVGTKRIGMTGGGHSFLPYFFSNRAAFLPPQSIIESIIGISVKPKGVMEYSERGGNSG